MLPCVMRCWCGNVQWWEALSGTRIWPSSCLPEPVTQHRFALPVYHPLSESNKTLKPSVRTKVTSHCRSVTACAVCNPTSQKTLKHPITSESLQKIKQNRGVGRKAGRQRSTHWKEKCEFGAFDSGGNTQNVLKFQVAKWQRHSIPSPMALRP